MNYRRNYVDGGTYFFTVNIYDRQSTLLVDQIDILRSAVKFVKQRKPFQINAWVVLPDHMHAIWTLPPEDSDYSSRWREIKKRFTKELIKDSFVHSRLKGKVVWQKRFWEHTIKSHVDFQKHFDYVHINPLKHGVVERVSDWPFSSFHRSVAQGLYSKDWCGDIDKEDGFTSYGECLNGCRSAKRSASRQAGLDDTAQL
jgi:putative transposase